MLEKNKENSHYSQMIWSQYREYRRIYKLLNIKIIKFIKVAVYQIKIQKLIAYLCISMKPLKN